MTPTDQAKSDVLQDMWKPSNPYESESQDWYAYNRAFNKAFCQAQSMLTREQYIKGYKKNDDLVLADEGQVMMF